MLRFKVAWTPTAATTFRHPSWRAPQSFTCSRDLFALNNHDTTHLLENMSGIGAELPPHLLAKRKRQQEEESKDAPATASGAKRSASPEEPEKRRKVMGPAMPPAPLDERPNEPPNAADDDSSSEDDDFGPALPTGGAVTVRNVASTMKRKHTDGTSKH